jgi:capsule polysaccharide export protein KpsE/RkpR
MNLTDDQELIEELETKTEALRIAYAKVDELRTELGHASRELRMVAAALEQLVDARERETVLRLVSGLRNELRQPTPMPAPESGVELEDYRVGEL